MGKLIAAALLAVGCGKVANNVVDGHPADALSDAFVCTETTKTLCGANTCSDLMTDEMNCGECGNVCVDGTTCGQGHCLDATLSCANALAANPMAPSGPVTHASDNHQFYCDMAHAGGPMQYEELGFGQYNVAHAGWDVINGTELAANPAEQGAFIFLFNKQAGAMTTITSWSSNNCCFKSTAGANVLFLGTGFAYPTTTNTTTFQCITTGWTAANYGFYLNGNAYYSMSPLPDNFFTTNPPSEAAGCTDSNNPGMFFRRHL